MNKKGRVLLLWLALLLLIACPLKTEEKKTERRKKEYLDAGPALPPFDVTKRKIPLEEIQGGGPPRDGIPAIMEPKFVSAKEAGKFLSDGDLVLGVYENGVAKAYPVKILNWHEIVNDEVGGRPVAVTW